MSKTQYTETVGEYNLGESLVARISKIPSIDIWRLEVVEFSSLRSWTETDINSETKAVAMMKAFHEGFKLNQAYKDEINKLRSYVDRNPPTDQRRWVDLDKIPETWKDGRALDALSLYELKYIGDDSENEKFNRAHYERHANDKWQIKICFKEAILTGSLPQEFVEYEDDNGACKQENATWVRSRKITHLSLPLAFPELPS